MQAARRQTSATREILLRFAKRHVGKPYLYGASPSEAPRVFDCSSSFVQYNERTGGRVRVESASEWLRRKDLVVVRRLLSL